MFRNHQMLRSLNVVWGKCIEQPRDSKLKLVERVGFEPNTDTRQRIG